MKDIINLLTHLRIWEARTPAGEFLHSTKNMDLVRQRYNLVVIFALMATKLYL
jgi:hypothetical protein